MKNTKLILIMLSILVIAIPLANACQNYFVDNRQYSLNLKGTTKPGEAILTATLKYSINRKTTLVSGAQITFYVYEWIIHGQGKCQCKCFEPMLIGANATNSKGVATFSWLVPKSGGYWFISSYQYYFSPKTGEYW